MPTIPCRACQERPAVPGRDRLCAKCRTIVHRGPVYDAGHAFERKFYYMRIAFEEQREVEADAGYDLTD